jgi:predicted DNA binding CopG/RHH family protein
LRVNAHTLREYRSDEEFKDAYKRGALPWSEIQRYLEWRRGELKDCRVAIRISSTDVMKLKALARIQEKKFHSYIGEILKREIHLQEERLATSVPDE